MNESSEKLVAASKLHIAQDVVKIIS